MHIFLLGDFESDNGPGNANKTIRDLLASIYDLEYSQKKGMINRIFEMYKGISYADILLVCSASQINYLAVKLAKKQGKKIIYLMHGYSSYEKKIERPELTDHDLRKYFDYENFIFREADCIVCVSRRCMQYMKQRIPQYADKFDYVFNIIDIDKIESICKNNTIITKKNQILSIGGGMKRKNILSIAEALKSDDVNLIVVGNTLIDGEKIRSFSNVTWHEHLQHEQLYRLMRETSLYIQNSIFEPFGLAVMEALFAGCSILVSNTVGCLDLFNNLKDSDIIFNVDDQDEIRRKVKYLLKNPNNCRLRADLKKEYCSEEWQIHCWKNIINGLNV